MDERTLEALFQSYRDDGDADAFAELFDRAAPGVRAVARRLAKVRGDVDDLVQATFVTAIERAATFDASRKLMPWLIGILTLHAKAHARRVFAGPREVEVAFSDDAPPIDGLIELEELAAVAQAIESLPEPYRSAVTTRFRDDGSSRREDSRGSNLGTLRTRLHRGILRLRKLFPRESFAGVFGVVRPDRSLARIREHVLATASGSKGIPAAIAGVSLGGIVVMKKISVVVVLVVLVAVSWIAVEIRPNATPHALPIAQSIVPPQVADPPADETANRVSRDVVAGPLAAIPTPATNPVGTRIQGRVVDASSSSPVANAACFVGHTNSLGNEVPKSAVRTGEDGRFEILGAEFDRFDTLFVVTDEFAVLRQPIEKPAKPTAERDGIDVGELQLVRGGTIRGRVLDFAGAPVPDCRLALFDLPRSFPTFYPMVARIVGLTGSDGTFVVEHVRPSPNFRWRLFALSSRGFAGVEFDMPGAAGFTREIEFRLAEPARLDVEVVNESGEPVVGVEVSAVPIAEPYVLGDWRSRPRSEKTFPGRQLYIASDPRLPTEFRATTDTLGRATIPGLPRSLAATVVAVKDGLQPAYEDIVTFAPDEPKHVRMTLRRWLKVGVEGSVIDVAGVPMPDVAVERYSGYQGNKSRRLEETRTDELGRFRFEEIAAGTTFDLCVGKTGIARRGTRVIVPADRGVEGLVLVATPCAPIAGIVVDDAGAPIAGAWVSAMCGDVLVRCDEWTTDELGRFLLSNTTTGRWRISTGLPGRADAWLEDVVALDVDAGDTEVRLVGIRDLPGRADLEVEIVDAVTQEPLDPIEALFGRRPDVPAYVLGGRGVDQRERGLVRVTDCKPGAWRLRVKCEGRANAFLDVDVAPTDTNLRLRLAVPPPVRLKGRITAVGIPENELRSALQHATVVGARAGQLVFGNGGDFVPTTVELNGSTEFAFEIAPNDSIFLYLYAMDLIGSARVSASVGGEREVEIQAVRAGFVNTRGGRDYPIARVTLQLTSENGADRFLTLSSPGQKPKDSSCQLEPGIVKWKLMYAPSETNPPPPIFSLPVIAEGTLVVRAGETTELALPAPPR